MTTDRRSWRRESRSADTSMIPHLIRDAFGEFLATFFFIFFQILMCQQHAGAVRSSASTLLLGVGVALLSVALLQVFGKFSGCHMNPAVTLSMVVCRRTNVVAGCIYVLMQCAGAASAAALYWGITPAGQRGDVAVTVLNEEKGVTVAMALAIESFATFFAVTVIHGATDDTGFTSTLPIGFALGASVIAAAPYTGGSQNPVRSLGPALLTGSWKHHWVFWVGPAIGSIVASLVYPVVFGMIEYDR